MNSSPNINILSISGGCRQLIGEAISDFNDKTIKNIFVPYITKGAVDIVDFTIAWVRSLDPVRC